MPDHRLAMTEPLRFGVFEIDPSARELRKHGVRIKLQDQPFAVLLILLETRPARYQGRASTAPLASGHLRRIRQGYLQRDEAPPRNPGRRS